MICDKRILKWFLCGLLKCRSNILRSYKNGEQWNRCMSHVASSRYIKRMALCLPGQETDNRNAGFLYLANVVVNCVCIGTKAIGRRMSITHYNAPGIMAGCLHILFPNQTTVAR